MQYTSTICHSVWKLEGTLQSHIDCGSFMDSYTARSFQVFLIFGFASSSFSSSSLFLSCISGVHYFGLDFCICDCLVTLDSTFRLHGWCMLGVYLLLAFTCVGHECQDALSPCDGMHVSTDDLGLYCHPKSFGGLESGPKGKSPSTGKISEEDRILDAASHKTASPTHYQLSYPTHPPPPSPLVVVTLVTS